MADPGAVGSLLQRLRAGGARVGSGRFRVDSSRALAKLRDFRLADPHHYVLELLRAAAASGATAVDLRVDAAEVELSFDGTPFPAEGLREVFGYLLAGGQEADGVRLRLLAFGLLGGLALPPREIVLQAGGLRLHLEPPDVMTVEDDPTPPPGTRVHLRRRRSLAVLRRWLFGSPEELAVRTTTAVFPVPLRLNGAVLEADPARAQPWTAQRDLRSGGRRLFVGLAPSPPSDSAWTVLATHGVAVGPRRLADSSLPVLAWIDDPRLRRNASGSDVVEEDPALRAALDAVRSVADELLGEIVNELKAAPEPTERTVALRRLLTRRAAEVQAERPSGLSRRARELLQAAPLLPGPAGEWISTAELKAEIAAGRPLRFSRRPHPRGFYDPPVVLFPLSEEQERLLPEGPRKDVEAQVQARLRREKNRAAWEAQAVEPARLAGGPWLLRRELESGALRGEVGFAAAPSPAAVRFLRAGKLLEFREVPELQPLRLLAVLDSETFGVDESWQGILEDAVYKRAVLTLREVAEAVLVDAAKAGEPAEPLRPHLRDLVSALASRRTRLPDALREAPLYPLAGGGFTSLVEIERRGRCRYVPRPLPHPAFDGEPVVVAQGRDREVLQRLLPKKGLLDFSEEMRRQQAVRERLAAPREKPQLPAAVLVKVALRGERGQGELGLAAAGGRRLRLRLLREGLQVAEEEKEAAFGAVDAVVEAPRLQPLPSWDGVVSDETYEEIQQMAARGQRELVRAILARYPRTPWSALPPPAAAYLEAFLLAIPRDWHAAPLDAVQSEVLEAPLFTGLHGPLSLLAILRAAQKARRVWLAAPQEAPRGVSPEMTVVVAEAAAAELVQAVTRFPLEHPANELARQEARRLHRARPERALELGEETALRVPLQDPPFSGVVGAAGGAEPVAQVEVLLERRLLCTLSQPSRLPLQATVEVDDPGVDPAEGTLAHALRSQLAAALARAEEGLVAQALLAQGAEADALLQHALASDFPERQAALRTRPLLPTIDGRQVSAQELEQRSTVSFVTERVEPGATGELVVLAVEPVVRRALARFGSRRRNMTDPLRERSRAARAHRDRPAAGEVKVPGESLRRRPFQDEELTGELALLPEPAGFVVVFHDQRPLCREAADLPPGMAAAVASERIKPKKDWSGVRRDHAFTSVLARTEKAAAEFAHALLDEWGALDAEARAPLTAPLAALLLWAFAQEQAGPEWLGLPLLTASDGQPLSLADLVELHAQKGRVLFSEARGSLVDASLRVWRPRPGERKLFPARRLRLVDATEGLLQAERVRTTPPLRSLAVPNARWSERVGAPGLEGEVGLPAVPGRKFVLELFRGRRLLEAVTTDHPVGGGARIDCDALQPDELWSRAARDGAFGEVRAAAEAGLERLLARVLAEGRGDWRAYVRPALRWKAAASGPVGQALATLELFGDVGGQRVTLGRVLAEASTRGGVAVLGPGLELPQQPDRLVLRVSEEDRGLLHEAGVKAIDYTAEARRQVERAQRMEERRLRSRRHEDAAVVRLAVDEGGWRGELALPDPPDDAGSVVLARQGYAVDRFQDGRLGVVGVLEHDALPVDEQWVEARLSEGQRAFLRGRVEALYAHLAASAGELPPRARQVAARHALRFLGRAGVTAPEHLDRLSGPAAALAEAKVLLSADGRWLDLRTVAAQALRAGLVEVVPEALSARDVGDVLVLRSPPDRAAPWAQELGQVLGAGRVRVDLSAAEWRLRRAERDPESGDPLAAGLALLRRETELLRADASGRLGPRELSDVRLRRGEGTQALRYDAGRAVVLLDPEHEMVRQALLEAPRRPEALYLLLAAVYGTVNRALDRVTDADEQRLVGALLEHLAANPGLLGGG